jgi:hypothetical protein
LIKNKNKKKRKHKEIDTESSFSLQNILASHGFDKKRDTKTATKEI